mgnify:CR=1 FL=1
MSFYFRSKKCENVKSKTEKRVPTCRIALHNLKISQTWRIRTMHAIRVCVLFASSDIHFFLTLIRVIIGVNHASFNMCKQTYSTDLIFLAVGCRRVQWRSSQEHHLRVPAMACLYVHRTCTEHLNNEHYETPHTNTLSHQLVALCCKVRAGVRYRWFPQ